METAMKQALVPPILDLTVDRFSAWKTWKEKWNDYSLLTGLEEKDEKYKSAMLRYTFTSETRNIYESLTLTAEDREDSATIMDALEIFAKGIINETMERHIFNCRNQEDGEQFDDFLTEIKILSKNCNFCNTCYNGLLRDRIVNGIQNDAVRQKLLSQKDLNLEKAINICRADEKAREGMKALRKQEKSPVEIDGIAYTGKYRSQRMQPSFGGKRDSFSKPSGNTMRSCKFCLRSHTYGREHCPAWQKQCHQCGGSNHFSGSVVCTKIPKSESKSGGEDNRVGALFLGGVSAESCELSDESNSKPTSVSSIAENDPWEIVMPTKKGSVTFKIDTGADVTVIGEQHLSNFDMTVADLKHTNKSLLGPDNKRLTCLGYFVTLMSWGDRNEKQICYVCKNVKVPLLGRPAIRFLNILKLDIPKSYSCASAEVDKKKEAIMDAFPKIFTGLGKIKGAPVQIHMDEGATPYQLSAPRRVPLPLLEPLKAELKRMEDLGVIRKVEQPTEWCHPIVVVQNPVTEKLRICLDLTKLNQFTKRELYQLETVDETIAKIGKECKFMSKLDANSGYWQLPLDEDSQLKATFITPFGRFCPTRAPFGLLSLPEIFNKRIDKIIEGLPGVAKSMDDFLIYASNIEEHDQRLHQFLNTLQENGVTLNADKCQFAQVKVEFLGHTISAAGIQPVRRKLDALTKFRPPENITELRRFMGMAQQLSKFSPSLAQAAQPLRDLLSTKNSWLWTPNHQLAFDEIKSVLASPPILAHYDTGKLTKLRTDGSKLNGISVILYQEHENEWKPVDCASRFLRPAEKNYHPVELEMLAVVWGCEKMAVYLQGLPEFTIETDHKPLVPILNYKPLIEMSPRIQSLRMKLLRFKFKATHVPGTELKDADTFSRAPVSVPTQEDEIGEQQISAHVNAVLSQFPATEKRIQEIKHATTEDTILTSVITNIIEGWPLRKFQCEAQVQPYWDFRGDLTYINGLILKGNRLVIPTVLRQEILQKIHEGHQGIDKCKRRARDSVFWPNLNNQIEQLVRRCETCLTVLPSKPAEPMLIRTLPTRPWQIIGSDLFQYANRHYIILVDYYSSWPEVYLLSSPNSKCVIEATKEAFAHHGIPEEVISDNGPQYSSREYKCFAKEWEFKHTTSSPHYPKSNGLAEATVKIVKGLIKKSNRSNKDIKKGLLIIRNTPLSCGKSPAELLTGHKLRDNLPRVLDIQNQPDRDLVQERERAKIHHDRRTVVSSTFREGQLIAIQDHITKEWTGRGKILREVAPRSFEIQTTNGRILRRNQQALRRLFALSVSTPTRENPPFLLDTPLGEVNDTESNYSETSEATIPYGEVENAGVNQNFKSWYSTEGEQTDVDSDDSRTGSLGDSEMVSRFGRTLKKKVPLDYNDL